LDFAGKALNAVVVNINAGMRIEEKQIHAIEFDSVYLGFRGQVEHRIEINARFRARAALPYQTGPHGVMKLGKIAMRVLRVHKWCIPILPEKLCRSLSAMQRQSRAGDVSKYEWVEGTARSENGKMHFGPNSSR
jgi:hypothetical protein